ncbi:MAG: homoprotocatechuate degradation operon regulator HpaR [Gammaproteobacteria bacterium]
MKRPDGTPRAGKSAAPLRDFSQSLPMLLLRSHQAVMAEFRPILREHGITDTQWRVLRALTTAESLRASQLAALTLVSGPSLTRILKALEQRRLISRRAEADDQRAARIAISAAGRRLIATVAPHSEARYRAIGERIGADRMDQLYALLGELPERLRRVKGAR